VKILTIHILTLLFLIANSILRSELVHDWNFKEDQWQGKLLKEKLRAGKTVYGTMFAHALDPAIVNFIPEDTLDFVIVTPEHTAYDLAEFLPVRHALRAL